MDNVPFHKTDMVRNSVAAAGHHLLYLPPYSPHLNSVESVISSMRNYVRQEVVQAETLDGYVLNGIRRIIGAMARGWIRELNRNFALAINGEPLGRLYNVRQALPEGYQYPHVEGWDEEQMEEEEKEEEEEEEEESEQVSDEEGDSKDGEMGAMLAPAPLHVKVKRKYSPPRNRSGRVRI
ncbi:Beta-site APP-cleaving enzyme [Linnemannia elongata]|nr:Beta-site APP-cleaving enzyme [Linnemannia elongata]